MKALNLFYICFICSYAAADIYTHSYNDLHSIYWLVGKLVGTTVLIICSALIIINNKDNSKLSSAVVIGCWVIFLGYYFYRDVAKYNQSVCQDKFGWEFNERRRKLGVPEIPADWNIESRGNRSMDWKGKESATGHESKYISIDSTCRIEMELDDYKLKTINGVSRDLSISTRYKNGKGSDSVFYSYYEAGDYKGLISRQQADSIFYADRINKDY
ncbi:hypothetical protein BH09BAC6_BH09BAC6_07900 [soil metagenome]